MGKGGLDKLLTGVDRAFIVTDRFMHESGKVSYLTEPMKAHGVRYEIFSDVKPDPDIATVTKGIGQLLDFKPQILFVIIELLIQRISGAAFFEFYIGSQQSLLVALPLADGGFKGGLGIFCFIRKYVL